ncbi:uncharacterized protein V6R79_020761 [Siganus canaliculatus]
MWVLTPLQPGGETHYLLSSKEYVVGRKNCDILLNSDQSISRAHAHLTLTDQGLTVKDTSKYGTFVNGSRLTENTPVRLKSGDCVTFGVFESKFSVHCQVPVVSSSCLDNSGKASLSQSLGALGGKLVNAWSEECTHLVMTTAKVTIKTICALLCCRPIVKPEFFSELSKAAQQKSPLPKAESFIPEIDEPSLNKEDVNLGAIPARKKIFSGKTFIFLTAKQLKRLSAAVGFGGGRTQLLNEGSLPRDLLESPHSCVIDITTDSSQAVLPPSTTQWTTSVKNIVQRKGLRVIPESEIGLAAIFASCDQYCNPSSVLPNSESVPKVNPRIPSASLSQSVAVDETVLPAASQNITAYAVNTEQSQRTAPGKVTDVTAVGETPEKKQTQNTCQLRGPRPVAQKMATRCIVNETMSSSINTVENTNSQRRKPDFEVTGAASNGIRSQPSLPRTNSGLKTFPQKQSPQKQRLSAQASPQKQSTLTSFFQTVNKKRPLEDDLSDVMSEPKRPVLDSSISIQAPSTPVTSKKTQPSSERIPAVPSLGSPDDLFGGQSETTSNRGSRAVQDELQSRKRKEVEAEIQLHELESIMSEDMDCFDEPPSHNWGQQTQPIRHSSADKRQGLNTMEAPSKRQRVQVEESATSKKPKVAPSRDEGFSENNGQKSDRHIISIKTERDDSTEYEATNQKTRKAPEAASATTNKNIDPFMEDEASFVEDLELLQADICHPKEEAKTPPKPTTVKQEVQQPQMDEELPQKLVLVEFRSLTVSAPPKTKPQKTQTLSNAKNFKCFRKIHVLGSVRGSAPIIGGSDLLAHNRGKNSDLDEWLRDAAEEERQSRRDETAGDDLFRYNPTKLTRRR